MWFLNIFLFLMFLFRFDVYTELVNSGSPCMSYYSWNAPTDPQPICPYDPANTNPFVPYNPQP